MKKIVDVDEIQPKLSKTLVYITEKNRKLGGYMVYKFLLRQVIFSFRILINGGPKTNILIGTCQNNSTFVFFLNTQISITTFSMLGGYQYIGIFGGTPLKSHHNKTLYTFSPLYIFFEFILNTAKICTKFFVQK